MSNTTSPYFNYRPDQFSDQYIIPNAEPGRQRGRMELAFSFIGGSVLSGALVGGSLGTIRGFQLVKDLPSFQVKRTQMINSIVKHSSKSASAFGVVAVVYSALGVALSFAQNNDDANTVAAGTLTGLITGALTNKQKGIKYLALRSGIGGGIGLGLSLLYSRIEKVY